jgi:hypothetical protein
VQRQRQACPGAQPPRREPQRPRRRIPKEALDAGPHIFGVEEWGQHLARLGQVIRVESGPATACQRHDLPFLGEHFTAQRAEEKEVASTPLERQTLAPRYLNTILKLQLPSL